MNFEPSFDRSADASEILMQEEGRRRKRRMVLGGLIIIIVLLVANMVFRALNKPAPETPSLPHVSVIVPGRQMVSNTISATGTLAAKREMPVGIAGEGGMISKVLVDAGDWVKAGQVLAVVERSVQTQQADQQRAQVAAARADADIAQSDLDRAQSLLPRGFISKADLDRKRATRDAALAKVRVAQAQLGEINARIGQLNIRAPAGGLLLTRAAEPGQIVLPTGGVLFRMARDGEMELAARLAETDLARLKVGDQAQVTPVGSSTHFAGHIWQISPIIDSTTRQGITRIQLAYDPALRPGGFAAASIVSGQVSAPLLPESAVLSDDKGNFVYVIDGDGKVVRRTVKTGQVSDAGIAIMSGLEGNERVVLSAGAFLSPGDKVIPETAGKLAKVPKP